MTENRNTNTNTNAQNIVALPDRTQIEREAAEWIARFDGDDAGPEDRAALEAWRSQSDQHEDALVRLADFWGGMAIFGQLKDYAVADDMTALLEDDRTSRRRRAARRILTGAVAASLVAAAVGAIHQFVSGSGQPFDGSFETAVGEQETIALPDGSNMILNTDSEAEVSFTRSARIVRLGRGEALFDVAPDRKKPFSVETEKGTVTAVGTAFSVRVHDDGIDVLVKEGRVALAPGERSKSSGAPASRAFAPVEVSAGQSVRFAQQVESIDVVDETALDRKLDWQDGMLSFKGEPLENVVAELGRYTDTTIEITDPRLKSQKIVAYYRVGEIETMFDALQLMDNIEVERVSARHVRLYRSD